MQRFLCLKALRTRPPPVARPVTQRLWCSTKAAEKSTSTAAPVLPGMDIAQRAVAPNQEFPATWSAAEPLSPNDPRVYWREHYSLEDDAPYYQNMRTNEVTWDIPDGFATRFPRLYEKNGFTLDEAGGVHRTDKSSLSQAAAAAGSSSGVKQLTMKQKLTAYGGGGLLWYLIVHNICLASIFSALYFFHIDLIAVARSYGFKIKRDDEVVVTNQSNPPFWKTFVLSIVLNKMLVPLQMVFTLATAPFLVRHLEPIAMRLFPKFGGKTKVATPAKAASGAGTE